MFHFCKYFILMYHCNNYCNLTLDGSMGI
jgi:hypothetical protein